MNNIVNKDIQLPVVGFDGKELRKITLDSEIFGIEPHMPSVHLAVKVDLANRRQATAKTKTRSEVSGGGKKPQAVQELVLPVIHFGDMVV